MNDLIARLHKALEEDERAIQAYVAHRAADECDSLDDYDTCSIHITTAEACRYRDMDFGLREVAAKREILALHQYQYEHPHSYCVSCELNPATTYVRQDGPWCPGVLALAKGYGIEVE